MTEQVARRTLLAIGFALGVGVSALSVFLFGSLLGRDDTSRMLNADLDLDDLSKETGVKAGVSGTIRAGTEFRVRMKKGSYSYVSFAAVIRSDRLEAISGPARAQ